MILYYLICTTLWTTFIRFVLNTSICTTFILEAIKIETLILSYIDLQICIKILTKRRSYFERLSSFKERNYPMNQNSTLTDKTTPLNSTNTIYYKVYTSIAFKDRYRKFPTWWSKNNIYIYILFFHHLITNTIIAWALPSCLDKYIKPIFENIIKYLRSKNL